MVNVQDYIGLVHNITNKRFKQFKHKYSYEDLFQNGCVGLMIAAKKFDESKNIKFTTFAYINIDYYILRQIRDDKWFMGNRQDRFTSDPPCSLDTPMADSNHDGKITTYLDQYKDDQNLFERAELNVLLDMLPDKLKEIIKLRYFNKLTQKEVAEVLGSKQVNISRYERKALGILREEMMA